MQVERPNADGTVDTIPVKPGQLMRWYDGPLGHSLTNSGHEAVPERDRRDQGR